MSDEKPGDGQPKGAPPTNAKSNGTAPTVSARRPLSKAEYARTTKATADATAVIPAVRDEEKAPEAKPSVDDRPTQTFKAVQADAPAAKPAEKKPEQPQQKADRFSKKQQKAQKSAPAPTPASAAAAAAPAPAPAAPSPTQAPAAPKPDQTKPDQTKPQQKSTPATKSAPAAPAKPASDKKKAAKPAAGTSPAAASSASTEAASTRSARLKLSHVEPWSVAKMAFVVSVALMIVSVVAVTVFWLVMQITGVWGALNDSVSNVLADDAAAFDVTDYLGFGRVVGLTLLVSSLNVIFMTALATIAAHLYNLAAGILGGIELTFGERK